MIIRLYQAQYGKYIWLILVSDWQRSTFAILYFTPESVYSNSPKSKKIYVYIFLLFFLFGELL